jgi:hypothetical protein
MSLDAAEAGKEGPSGPWRLLPSPPKGLAMGWALLLVGLLAWTLLLFSVLGQPQAPYFDEMYNAGAAQEFVEHRPVREITHPPLYKMVEAAFLWWQLPEGVRAFEVDYGTLAKAIRMPSVLMGAGALLAMAWLATALYGQRTALVLTALLALDPMFIVLSRTAMNYTYAMCFILLGLAAMTWALRVGQSRWLWLAGLGFGLALSMRWTSAFGISGGLLALLFARARPELLPADWKGLHHLSWARCLLLALVALAALPVLTYVASYAYLLQLRIQPTPLGWGNYLPEWWRVNQLAYHIHNGHSLDHASATKWYTWPFQVGASVFSFKMDYPNNLAAAIIGVGNPLVWASAPFGLALALGLGGRRGHWPFLLATLPAWVLIATWAAHGHRMGFNHYFLEAIPFALLSWGGLFQLEGLSRQGRLGTSLGLVVLALSFGFLVWRWPLTVGSTISVDTYIQRVGPPRWEAVSQSQAYRRRNPMSKHELAEMDQRVKFSLHAYMTGRKDGRGKAWGHDDRMPTLGFGKGKALTPQASPSAPPPNPGP